MSLVKPSQAAAPEAFWRERMKKLLHGPHRSDLSVGRNPRSALSPLEMEADPCVCSLRQKSTSHDFALSPGKCSGPWEAGKEGAVEDVELSWDRYLKKPCGPVGQSLEEGVTTSKEEEEGGLRLDLRSSNSNRRGSSTADWRQEEGQRCCPPRKPPTSLAYRAPPPRDRSSNVIEYIVKELQGISRIQTEIAELQQHLALIKGSVEEVSSCVDTVLSEIEGLQNGCGSSSSNRTPGAPPKAREAVKGPPSPEPILCFYGLPEQEGENTKEFLGKFLAQYHGFNGLQHSQYIQEAYRSSAEAAAPPAIPLGPRPAVVRFTDEKQRDSVLQKAILLQRVGVTVVASREPSHPHDHIGHLGGQGNAVLSPGQRPILWDSGTLQGDVVRTDGDGQFQLDSGQDPYENASQEVHGGEEEEEEEFSIAHKSTPAGDCCLMTELKEGSGRVRQDIGKNEHSWANKASSAWDPDASSPEQPEDPRPPKDHEQDTGSSPEEFSIMSKEPASCEGGGRGLDGANATSKETSLLVEETKAGGPTPGESETDWDAATTTTLEFLSPDQGSLLEEAPRMAVMMPSHESTVCKLVGSTETLKDMVQIDLNEQDPTEQVFREVLENSQYFLEHSRDSVDLVDMRFYTNKLGKALSHFRSALQVVFHKLETGDPEVLLEGGGGGSSSNKSFPAAAPEPAPTLPISSTHSNLENFVESPPSQSSDSQANTTLSSDSVALAGPRALHAGSLSPEEAPSPVPGAQSPLHPESCAPAESVSCGQGQEELGCGPEQPNGCRPMSLEKVCAETIYLNKCINNFKSVLQEKRQLRRRLLKEVSQEASWSTSADETHAGTGPVPHQPSL